MVDSSAKAVERLAEARRQAETELKKTLAVVANAKKVEPCLPAFEAFAYTLFDTEADELFPLCEDCAAYMAALEKEAASRIVEGIMPDRGLAMAWAGLLDEWKGLPTEKDVGTGLLWEGKPDKSEGIRQGDREARASLGGLARQRP